MTDEELIARLRKYEDDLLSITADRIEALTEQLAAARQDAKEAEAYAEELEKGLNTCHMAQIVMDNTVADLEAKLAKAVDAINVAAQHEPKGLYPDHVPNYWLLRATLAAIKAP